MKVRPALLTDITRIIIFCRAHEHLLRDDDPRVDAGYLRRQLRNCIKDSEAVVLVAIGGNQIKGVLIGWLMNWAWNPQRYGTDILFLADQGGDYLMRKFEAWCRQHGARRVLQTTHLEYQADRVEKFYSRSGRVKTGHVWEKML